MAIVDFIASHLSIGTVLVGITAGLLAYWMSKKIRYRIPPGPFALPLIGNYELFTDKNLLHTVMEMSNKYGPVVNIKIGPTDTYFLNTIEVALEALVKKGSDFADRAQTTTGYDFTDGGKDIALANYTPTWKLHRKIASTALRQYLKGDKLQTAVDDSMKEIIRIISKQEEEIDPKDYVDFIVFNILCALCFKQGYAFDDPEFMRIMKLDTELLQDLGNGAMEDFIPIIKYICPTKTYTTFMAKTKELHAFIKGKLEEHKRTFDADNIRDFTDNLLLARQEAEHEDDPELLSKLTDVHLKQTLSDIFFAGIDTSRMTLQWAILCLAVHKEMQTKCQEEVDKVVGRDTLPKLTDRPNLPYTEAFLMEVMRLYPVAGIGVPHAASRDSTIHGYDAPKGTTVIINHYAILRDPKHWDKPDEFNPNRFLDRDGKMLPKPESWLPFSAGRRVCLGESVAKPELLNIFATLIHQFDIRFPEGFVHTMGCENLVSAPFPKPYKVHMQTRA